MTEKPLKLHVTREWLRTKIESDGEYESECAGYFPPETGPITEKPEPVSACPRCGCQEYSIRLRITGTIDENHRFDGGKAGNEGMWDSVRARPLKIIRCRDCRRPVTITAKEE